MTLSKLLFQHRLLGAWLGFLMGVALCKVIWNLPDWLWLVLLGGIVAIIIIPLPPTADQCKLDPEA